jgi:hypothetical protein
MDDFIGVNLRREDPTHLLEPIGFVREYHAWGIDEDNAITPVPFAYPNNANKFSPGFGGQSHTQFPFFYAQLNQNLKPSGGTLNKKPICATINYTLPAISGFGYDPSNLDRSYAFSEMKPVWPQGSSPIIPAHYQWFADYVTQFSNHFVGPGITAIHDKALDTDPINPLNPIVPIGYVELWNETDKNASWYPKSGLSNMDPRIGFTPQEYAAITSATFDGHQGAITGTKPGSAGTYTLGVNQFTNQKFVMAGLSDIADDFSTYLTNFVTHYNTMRGTTNQFPFKVINFHHYCDNNWRGLGTIGVSPESDNFTEPMPTNSLNKRFKQRLKEVKTQFIGPGTICPTADCEIWMSEFGWDTNLGSDQRAPAIGGNDQEEVQGQWLVRGYMEIAAAGWDRAMQFCIRDEDSRPSSTRFQASGILRDRYHNHAPKKSYYYISTMKEALNNMKFQQEFSSNINATGSTASDVRIMRYVKSGVATPSGANNGDFVIALWLPSSTASTLATSFNLTTTLGLPVNTANAVLIRSDPRDMNGIITTLTVTGPASAPTITIPANTISERPIYIQIGSMAVDAATPTLAITSQALSCNSVRLSWNPPPGTFQTYRVYYYEKSDSEEGGTNPVFDPSNRDWKMYTFNYPAQVVVNGSPTEVKSVIVSGLTKMEDEYHFYVEGITSTGLVTKTTLHDIKTLACEGGTINSASFTFSPNSTPNPANGQNAFSLAEVEQCYPQNTRFIDPQNQLKPFNYAPAAALPADITVNLGGTFNIESLSIFDVNNAGYLSVEYSTNGTTFLPFKTLVETYFYEWWTHVPVPMGALGVTTLRIKKLGLADYGRIVVHGKLASATYTAADCCPQIATTNRKVFGTPGANAGTPSTSVSNLSSQYPGQIGAITTPEIVVHGTLNMDLPNSMGFSGTKFLMMTGSKIVVPTGKSLALLNSSLRGCTHLWDQITLNGTAYANLDNTKIRDARVGLQLISSTTSVPVFYISNSRIERCYRGISSSAAALTTKPGPQVRFLGYGSVIDGTDDDLKPHWDATLDPFFNKRAYHGVLADNLNSINIGYTTVETAPTTIKNLHRGLDSYSSVVNINYTAFQNMTQPRTFPDPLAIQATSTTLTMLGGQGTVVLPEKDRNTFDNVTRAVVGTSTGFDIRNVKTSALFTAVDITNASPKTGGNKLLNWNVPVTTGATFKITSNTTNGVEIANNVLRANGNGDAIYVGVITGTSTDPVNIHHNTIEMRATTGNNAAIRVIGASNPKVEDNPSLYYFYGTLPPSTTNTTYGIYTANTTGAQINRNKVHGSAFVLPGPIWDWNLNSYNRIGLFVQNSSGWTIGCNTIDEVKRGMLFEGTGSSSINGLYNNELRKMPIGLELINNGMIGNQTDRWTKWTFLPNYDPMQFPGSGAAKHWSALQADWVLSRLIVPSATTGPNAAYSPQTSVSPVASNNNNNGWVFRTSTATPPATCAPAVIGTSGDRGGNEYAEKIRAALEPEGTYAQWVLGKIDHQSLGEVSVWQMQKAIYHALYTDAGSDYANLPHYAQFLDEQRHSAIGMLHAVATGIGNDLDWSAEYESERKLLSAELEAQNQRIAEANTQLGQVSIFERANYIQRNPNLFMMADIHGEMLQLDAEMQKRAKENAHTLELINSSIPVENGFAALEQEVNEIFLRTAGVGSYHFDQTDLQRLEKIASKCPAIDGDAVVKARVLYSYTDAASPARWSDDCQVEIKGKPAEERKVEPPLAYSLRTVPNPTTGDFWYTTDAPIGTEWVLTDMLGRIIKHGEVTSPYWVRVEDTQLDKGLYLLTMRTATPVTTKIIRH